MKNRFLKGLTLVSMLVFFTYSNSEAQDKKQDAKPAADAPKAAEPAKPAANAPKAAEPVKPAADAPKADAPKAAAAEVPLSFMKDVAPLLVQNCIACHNPRKSESKYVMTTFEQLAKGGQQGEDVTLIAGDVDGSYFIELIRHDGTPRMPWKQDPLPLDQIAKIEKWVAQGAKYDGKDPKEDWPTLLHKQTIVPVPENYPTTVPITSLAFSPDGSNIATGGFHEIVIWNVGDGSIKQRVQPLQERIYDISYSSDGKFMATAAGDPGRFGTAKIWKAKPDGTVEFLKDLGESSDAVFAIAFSPDSKKVAAAGADRTIRVWSVPEGNLELQLEDHADWILDLSFSPDGTKLVSASRDKTTKVFDVVKKESLVTFPSHNEQVFAARFSKDGKQIFSGGADKQIRTWTAEGEAKQVRATGGFGGEIFKVALAPDGGSLLAASADKTVRVFKTDNMGAIRQLAGQNDWVYSLAVSNDGQKAAAGGWDGRVVIWNLADGKPLKTFIAAPGQKLPEEPAKK